MKLLTCCSLALAALALLPCQVRGDSKRVRDPETGHEYMRVDQTWGIWLAGKKYCSDRGGYLASITSEREDRFIYRSLLEAYPPPNQFWLGGSDEKTEGVWEWLSGEPWTYGNWMKDEPNNNDGWEHCLVYGHDKNGIGWNDIPCARNEYGYICEWDPPARD